MIRKPVSRRSNHMLKNKVHRIWDAQNHNVKHRHQFVSGKFKEFCKTYSIERGMSLSCSNQSNDKTENCIKFIKETKKKCFDTNANVPLALLQIRLTPLRLRLPSPTKSNF